MKNERIEARQVRSAIVRRNQGERRRSAGLTAVSSIAGLVRNSIERGKKDLDAPPISPGGVHSECGKPRWFGEREPIVLADLRHRVEPADAARSDAFLAMAVQELRQTGVHTWRDGPPSLVRLQRGRKPLRRLGAPCKRAQTDGHGSLPRL